MSKADQESGPGKGATMTAGGPILLRRTGHVLLAAVAALLAVLIVADCAAAQAASPSSLVTVRTVAAPTSDLHADAVGLGERGTTDCEVLRTAPAPVTAPTLGGAARGVCGGVCRDPEQTPLVAAPLTGRQAVPVSRSGEVPVFLQNFRC